MKIKVGTLRKIIRETLELRRNRLLAEDAASVVDAAHEIFKSNPRISDAELSEELESATPYEDLKAFLALPKQTAMSMMVDLPNPSDKWLKTWRGAYSVVFAREG